MSEDDTSSWLVSNAAKLLGLYAGYVFLSGWAFLDSYYRFYGIDPKSLDLGFYEVLIKGFTILFSELHFAPFSWTSLLWVVYICVVIVPILTERRLGEKLGLRIGMALFFIGLLIPVFFIAQSAGEQRARLDTGEKSRLSSVTFSLQNQSYHGKLVLLRGGMYFIHGVAPLRKEPEGIELSVYRADDLKEVKIAEHQ